LHFIKRISGKSGERENHFINNSSLRAKFIFSDIKGYKKGRKEESPSDTYIIFLAKFMLPMSKVAFASDMADFSL
jgi:hypothetical protein